MYITLATQQDNTWQFCRDTLHIVFEIFAMVDETEFMLLHRPYIGNFD